MRIFANCREMLNEVIRDAAEMGVLVRSDSVQDLIVKGKSDYFVKELQNYSFCILNMNDKDKIIKNLLWLKKEFMERIAFSPVNPGEAWKLRKDVFEKFLHEGKFSYTYSERINDQIYFAYIELLRNPNSRQIIVQVFNAEKDMLNLGGLARIPCSLNYQLMIREDKLDIIYNMRSCDISTHFCNDIWLADEFRNYIAGLIHAERGKFFMNIASLHIFKKDCRDIF